MSVLKNKIITVCMVTLVFQVSLGQFGNEPKVGNTVDYNNISMPESPNASAFNAVGSTNVNTATGVPSISIPIYTFELDGVKVPISISYNAAGVKVSDLATPVGLNWSLQAGGQISRTVRGKTDEYEGWLDDDYTFLSDDWYDDYDENNPDWWQEDMLGTLPDYDNGHNQTKDHNPDFFSYSFLGHSNNFIHYPDGYDNNGQHILKEKQDGIEISFLLDGNTNTDMDASDMQGNSYTFSVDDTEKSRNHIRMSNQNDLERLFYKWENQGNPNPITAWKLSEVKTKNDKTINFDYHNVDMDYDMKFTSYNLTLGGTPPSNTIHTLKKTETLYDYSTQLIDKISSPDSSIEVNFNYSTDTGLPDSVWKTKLTSIVVSDLITGNTKEYRFTYERYIGDPRLKLTGVQEVGYDSNNNEIKKPAYVFDYEDTPLPAKTSYSQDFFGYYNNSSCTNSLVPNLDIPVGQYHQQFYDNNTCDRSLNANAVEMGILKKITFPTGGHTNFTYEPNVINDRYCGGLRVQEIENIDGTDIYNRKTYQYEGLVGYNLKDNSDLTVLDQGGDVYHSNFIKIPGDIASGYRTGYFYNKVTVRSFNDSESFLDEFVYEENINSFHRYDYALTSQTSFKGSQKLKIVEYDNRLVGTAQVFRWNVLPKMENYETNNNEEKLGYDDRPVFVFFKGDYAYLPKRIATTQFLKRGSSLKPVTTVQYIDYDDETLLKTQQITDYRRTRNDFDDYPIEDNDGERTTTDYQYPWNVGLNLPDALPISKVTSSLKLGGVISGQYFKYDSTGNIKNTFQFSKGQGSNNSGGYVPNDYDQIAEFEFENGKPVQMLPENGIPTSYIWGYENQYPVAKIEGVPYDDLNVTAIHNESDASSYNEEDLIDELNDLREDFPDAMITTYTHLPIFGVSTITDPKEDETTYHYDGLGRLKFVRDKQGKLLTEKEYNFGNSTN